MNIWGWDDQWLSWKRDKQVIPQKTPYSILKEMYSTASHTIKMIRIA